MNEDGKFLAIHQPFVLIAPLNEIDITRGNLDFDFTGHDSRPNLLKPRWYNLNYLRDAEKLNPVMYLATRYKAAKLLESLGNGIFPSADCCKNGPTQRAFIAENDKISLYCKLLVEDAVVESLSLSIGCRDLS